MSKIKRIAALLLALVMVMGMSVTSFAEKKKPTENDSMKVTIENVEAGATFRAYQLIDAAYDPNGGGFTGYVWAEGTSNAGQKVTFQNENGEENIVGLTDQLVTALAANPSGLTGVNPEGAFDPAQDALTAGTWMILVTPPTTNSVKVYNPMIVSVYYKVDGSGSMGELGSDKLDANTNWTLETTNAFAKSSEITLTKDLDNPQVDTEVMVGQTVPFTITSQIPSYSSEYYKDPVFNISDTIVNGLEYTGKPQVYVGGVPAVSSQAPTDTLLTEGDQYTLTYNSTSGFEIAFTKEYIHSLAGTSAADRAVTVKYSATVLDSAVTKVGENKANVEYSSTPGQTATKEDKEYVFTFALHGVFNKVDDANKKLKGAKFTLYVEDKNGSETLKWSETETENLLVSKVNDYTTTDDGEIKFKGLDGDKVYYLKETEAPSGYSINDTIYKVTFEFNKPDNYEGADTTYTVHVSNNKNDETASYTVTYGESHTDEYGKIAVGSATDIPNTKLSSLPSTGGIGTTIFTIGGCLIMIVAAGLFFATRKKSAK